MTARCVCGHELRTHAYDDATEGGECSACVCAAFVTAHLPGQVMLGEGE